MTSKTGLSRKPALMDPSGKSIGAMVASFNDQRSPTGKTQAAPDTPEDIAREDLLHLTMKVHPDPCTLWTTAPTKLATHTYHSALDRHTTLDVKEDQGDGGSVDPDEGLLLQLEHIHRGCSSVDPINGHTHQSPPTLSLFSHGLLKVIPGLPSSSLTSETSDNLLEELALWQKEYVLSVSPELRRRCHCPVCLRLTSLLG